MRGRRGGVHQDHPVVIINWNFQCHMFAHSGGLGEKKTQNYQANLILKLSVNEKEDLISFPIVKSLANNKRFHPRFLQDYSWIQQIY